jgi:anaerobic magnesium-protoporphyrin IX monomethyl ester cyclase
MTRRKTVVLFYPPYDGPPLGAPLSLLTLASPLLHAGFEVKLVDGAISPDFEEVILRETQDAVCLGISLLTGPMINSAIRVAAAVKKAHPKLPVVFGGWHPSLVPEQTLQPAFVDCVVRAQGELTLLELVQRISEGRNWDGVLGLCFKDGDAVRCEAERPVANINTLPAPAFHLVPFDRYELASGVRQLAYASSVGCPYACSYCTDMVFYKRRFNAYLAEKVVDDLCDLVPRYRIDEVALLDSNFLVDIKRAIAIARGIIVSGVKFRWTFQASTDFLWRMSDEDVQLLGESGVTHMGFGTESASENVLKLMNKHHQRVEQMAETARKAELAGIHVTFNLILGYPGETEEDRLKTFQIMSEIAKHHWNVSFSPNIFTPYPGIPIWPELKKLGVREPQSLEEWQDVSLGHNLLPWLQGEELRRLRRSLEYFLLNNEIRKATKNSVWFRRGFRRALGAPIRWRIGRSRYSFPWELWVSRAVKRVVTRRSLLTGQKLSERMQEVC